MNLTIKDLPPRLHRKLKAQAASNKRSLNWEVIDIIERAVEPAPLDVDAILSEAAAVRSRIKGPPLTNDLIKESVNHGRA